MSGLEMIYCRMENFRRFTRSVISVSDSKHAEEEKAEFRRKLQTWFPGIEVSESRPREEEKADFKRKHKTWFPDLRDKNFSQGRTIDTKFPFVVTPSYVLTTNGVSLRNEPRFIILEAERLSKRNPIGRHDVTSPFPTQGTRVTYITETISLKHLGYSFICFFSPEINS
ncbi:hypothetical protein PO909_019900 [Leuciscus waleckii]